MKAGSRIPYIFAAIVLLLVPGAVLVAGGRMIATILRWCASFWQSAASPQHLTALLFTTALALWLLFRLSQAVYREIVAATTWQAFRRTAEPLVVPGITSDAVHVLVSLSSIAMTVGFRRPQTYFSTGLLRTLSREELSGVLAHEQEHRRRRDPLRIFVWNLLAHLFPFLPVIPQLARHAVTDCELAADAAAVAKGVQKAAIFSALQKVIFGAQASVGLPSNAAFAVHADVRARVHALRDEAFSLSLTKKAIFVTLFVVGLLFFSAVRHPGNAQVQQAGVCASAPVRQSVEPMSKKPATIILPSRTPVRLLLQSLSHQ